jgi:hypothetical protein
LTLPTDRDARNALPIWSGVLSYFPDAWGEIAKVSVLGNAQHNLGASKLYFNRGVSTDHLNKVLRHCLDHEAGNVFDDNGQTRHLAKAAWRILAALQVSIETDRNDVNGRIGLIDKALPEAYPPTRDLACARASAIAPNGINCKHNVPRPECDICSVHL